jgi:ribonuclease Z
MSDALFNEAYKIDIAARKSLHSSETEGDINIQVKEISHGDQIEADGWRVRATEVKHWPIPVSLGLLVETNGRRVFFTGDTAPCDAVREDAAGVDLLIHEAMYFPKDSGHYRSHSHPTQAGEVARQAGVKHLILTHLQPKSTEEQLLNDATTHFSQKISTATDQMRIVV